MSVASWTPERDLSRQCLCLFPRVSPCTTRSFMPTSSSFRVFSVGGKLFPISFRDQMIRGQLFVDRAIERGVLEKS